MIEIRKTSRLVARTFFAALLAATLAGPAFAQPDGGGFGPPPGGGPQDGFDNSTTQRGPNVDRELKKLTKLLTLTADQQTQVKVLLTERNQKIGELMKANRPASKKDSADNSSQTATQNDGPPDAAQFEQIRTQMKAIRDEANTKIGALLTDEQATKFKQWLKQQKRSDDDGMPPPPPDGGTGGPPPDGGGPGGGGPPAQ
ncbi:MAG: Spy/CpxP family protein refolding chaperone [Terracidiphilus sp.]|nr:Spy/CpxP family protein refolding chaperone [Terracidiphilus sp.]